MRSLEDIFIKEFKDEIRGSSHNKDIYSLPLPIECNDWYVSETDLYKVADIDVQYFDALNGAYVSGLKKGVKPVRRVIDRATRDYAVDKNGNIKTEDVVIPAKSIVILSDVKIKLPYEIYIKPTKEYAGYLYIDFITGSDGNVYYMYAIPAEKLHKVNQTALAISMKNMKSYDGMKYLTWERGTVFVCVIPYKPGKEYVATKILVTRVGLDYSNELNILLNFWQRTGVIPDLLLTETEYGDNLAKAGIYISYDSYDELSENAVYEDDVDVYTDAKSEEFFKGGSIDDFF